VRVAGSPALDWPALRDRVFSRLDDTAEAGRQGREETGWITVHRSRARFTGPRRLAVDGAELTADQVVIAVGGRPVVPPPVAESGLPYETSDTVMRVAEPPRRLAVLGGGYIACELAEVFCAAGSEIVVIEQEPALLGPQDEQVSAEFTDLAGKRWDLRLGRSLESLDGGPGALRLTLDDGTVVEADMLLAAAGRAPNTGGLGLDRAGVEVDDGGRVVVDAHQRTTAEGVWALGDVCTPVPLKHVANREAEVVRHNLRHPGEPRAAEHDLVPAAVFANPRVASIGATEQRLREDGTDYRVGLARTADTAYGWAMAEPPGFAKVLVAPDGHLLGAHVMGPEAPTLIQPLVLAMTFGLTADDLLNRPYWIHPAMTEVVQQALDDLGG
jgi:mycothione reductase